MSKFPILTLLIIGALVGAGLAYALAPVPNELPTTTPPVAVPDALAADETIGYR